MKEIGAALAGEMSGHTFFEERWYGFDDGLYAGARLLEILSRARRPVGGARRAARRGVARRSSTSRCAEGEHHALDREARRRRATFPGATEVIRIDGLRVEYPDGFGLARASNTTPVDRAALRGRRRARRSRASRASSGACSHAAKPGIALPF